jgi:hypothetical protein
MGSSLRELARREAERDGRDEKRRQRSEVRGRKSEDRGRKSEDIRTEFRISDCGLGKAEDRISEFGLRIADWGRQRAARRLVNLEKWRIGKLGN